MVCSVLYPSRRTLLHGAHEVQTLVSFKVQGAGVPYITVTYSFGTSGRSRRAKSGPARPRWILEKGITFRESTCSYVQLYLPIVALSG